jgi:hypothetical protein
LLQQKMSPSHAAPLGLHVPQTLLLQPYPIEQHSRSSKQPPPFAMHVHAPLVHELEQQSASIVQLPSEQQVPDGSQTAPAQHDCGPKRHCSPAPKQSQTSFWPLQKLEQHWALKSQPTAPAKQTQNPPRHVPEQQSFCATHACPAALQAAIVVLVVTLVLVVLGAGTVSVVLVVLLPEGASVVLPGTSCVRVVVVGGGSHAASPCLRQSRTTAARQRVRARRFGWLALHSARRVPQACMHARRGVILAVRGAAARTRAATARSLPVSEERWSRPTPSPYRNSVMDGKDDLEGVRLPSSPATTLNGPAPA